MRRGISVAAALTALALTATACGGDDDDSSNGKAKSAKDVSGSITYWDTSDATTEEPVYRKLIDEFEDKYPKIKVHYENVEFASVEQKFKSAAKTGKGAPDVMRADVGLIPEYASLHYIAPLDGTLALKGGTDDFTKGPLNTTKYQGRTYGVPSVTDTLGILYNKKLFKRAGIKKAPATWDEFIATAKTIKKRTGVEGTYLNPDSYFLLPFLYGEGTDLADTGSKKITINSPQAVKAVKTAKKVYDEASMKVDFANSYDNMQTAFKNGEVAMVVQGPWSVTDDLSGKAFKGNEDNLGYAPVPAGSTGKAQAPTGGHDLVVYQGSKNLDAGYLFTQFMTSSASQQKIAKETATLPTRDSAFTDEVTEDARIKGFHPIMKTARPRVALPQVGSLFTPLVRQYIKILQGQVSVEDGLDAAAEDFKDLLPGYSLDG